MRVKFQGLKEGREWEYCWTGVESYSIRPYSWKDFCKEYPNIYTERRDKIERAIFDNIDDVVRDMKERAKKIVYPDDIQGMKEVYLIFIRYVVDDIYMTIGAAENLLKYMFNDKDWWVSVVTLRFGHNTVKLLMCEEDFLEIKDGEELITRHLKEGV